MNNTFANGPNSTLPEVWTYVKHEGLQQYETYISLIARWKQLPCEGFTSTVFSGPPVFVVLFSCWLLVARSCDVRWFWTGFPKNKSIFILVFFFSSRFSMVFLLFLFFHLFSPFFLVFTGFVLFFHFLCSFSFISFYCFFSFVSIFFIFLLFSSFLFWFSFVFFVFLFHHWFSLFPFFSVGFTSFFLSFSVYSFSFRI